jgi:DNA-binding transcriptional MocR family regulator
VSVIDFGNGQPSLSLLPVDALRTAADHFLARRDASWLQYGADQGETGFLTTLAAFLTRRYGAPVNATSLMATTGNSQALDLVCTLFTKPGDTIFVEEPTYFLALEIFRDHGLHVVGIPIDGDGLRTDALRDALRVHQPVLLYTIPSFQNPTGITLSAARRQALLDLCAAHDVLVVADEVYQLLDFGVAPPPPLATYDIGRVLGMGSFSKICAPGLRLGWLHGSAALLERVMQSGLVQSGGGLNPFTSGVVQSLLELGLADAGLDALKQVYAARTAVLCQALRDALPDVRFVVPQGGYFVWAELPAGESAAALLSAAREVGVTFHPGTRFVTRDVFGDTMRLSFAHYDEPQLIEGVARLARARRSPASPAPRSTTLTR